MQQKQTPVRHQKPVHMIRENMNEVQKIEIANFDVENIEIDTRILNKIKRKMGGRK